MIKIKKIVPFSVISQTAPTSFHFSLTDRSGALTVSWDTPSWTVFSALMQEKEVVGKS